MKNLFLYIMLLALVPAFMASCSEDDLSKTSVFSDSTTTKQNQFDKWLEANYVQPYNLEFKYRYVYGESDRDYFTVPAKYEDAVVMAHVIKYIILESYDEAGGVDFTRKNFPKMIYCIGEFEYRNNGTMVLGTAENGKKILMTGSNYISKYQTSISALNKYYLKTIHHEFTHILNQTVDFPANFKLITADGYVSDSWSTSPYSDDTYAHQHGFITPYSQHSATEDFAEMLSVYVTSSKATWNSYIEDAGTNGAALLNQKLSMVRSYMKDQWNIDIDNLRDIVQRRSADLAAGKVNLTDLSVK